MSFYISVKFRGVQTNLDKFIKGSICGLANLNIATGIQGKILTYMSYGLPVICSNKAAQNFVNKVGDLSEKENHHPDIFFGWGYCKVKIFTHAIKGLAESDFILAAKIDKI